MNLYYLEKITYMFPILAVKPGLARHSDLSLLSDGSFQAWLTGITFRSDRSRAALETLAWHQLDRVVSDLPLDALGSRLPVRSLWSDAAREARITVTARHARLTAWTAHSTN